jgi:hypothetical protein
MLVIVFFSFCKCVQIMFSQKFFLVFFCNEFLFNLTKKLLSLQLIQCTNLRGRLVYEKVFIYCINIHKSYENVTVSYQQIFISCTIDYPHFAVYMYIFDCYLKTVLIS